ncbi:RNA polymerase sigma factor [Pedobacter sp. WC2501]|uniref:RNA polymerase sigma factor n=1 Tax=Pedobacter sp. WC2501 TaxID=3461400 RepID=UPI004045F2ED
MEISDQILLKDLQNGNQSAYELVFKKYYKALALKAYLMLENEMEAEDLVQNLFISMWEKSQFLSVNTALKAYLFKAVHNKCLMCLRKRKTDQQRLDEYTHTLDLATDEEFLADAGDEKMIRYALEELPAQRQKAFQLVYLEDKKYKEAATEMGLSVNSVKTHLKLAVKMLQEKLISFR